MTALYERKNGALPRQTVESLARFSQWVQPLEHRERTDHVMAHHIQQEPPIHPVVESKPASETRWSGLPDVTFETLKALAREGCDLRFTYACDEVRLCFTARQPCALQTNGIDITDVRDITVSSGSTVAWRQDSERPFTTRLTSLAINSDLIHYLERHTA